MHLKALKQLARAFPHILLAHKSCPHRVSAQPHVIRHAAAQGLVKLLVYHGNALAHGVCRTFEIHVLTAQTNDAAILMINPEQALEQRGFSRTVFPH